MHPVEGAGDDMHIGIVLADVMRDLGGLVLVVDGDDHDRGLGNSGRMKHVGAGGIAEIGLHPEGAQHFQLFRRKIDHHNRFAKRAHHPRDDAADAAMTQHDDLARLVDLIGLALLLVQEAGGHDAVVKDEQAGRQQHRQGDDQQGNVGHALRDHVIGDGEGQKHEAELARLRQCQREQRAVAAAHAENPTEPVKHRRLQHHQRQCRADDDQRIIQKQAEIDARPHGHEEQTQQQPPERVDIAFQLVPVFAAGQNHAGQEGAKRRRQSHRRHQQRDADHEAERGGDEDLAQAGHGDIAEDRPGQIGAGGDHHGDGRKRDQRHLPAGPTINQAETGMCRLGGVFGHRGGVHQPGHGQQRDEGQHRDDRDVLKQQDRERGLPAVRTQQPLFPQRLQHDGC